MATNKSLHLVRTNLNIPTLPPEAWGHILQIWATKAWFQSKCVPEIQTTVQHTIMNFWATTAHHAITQSEPPAYVEPFEGWPDQHGLNVQSLLMHKGKEVTYRLCLANENVYRGGPLDTIFQVKRAWVEPCSTHHGQSALAKRMCHTFYCDPIMGGAVVIVNVSLSTAPPGPHDYPERIPKIPRPKQLNPVAISNSVGYG